MKFRTTLLGKVLLLKKTLAKYGTLFAIRE